MMNKDASIESMNSQDFDDFYFVDPPLEKAQSRPLQIDRQDFRVFQVKPHASEKPVLKQHISPKERPSEENQTLMPSKVFLDLKSRLSSRHT